MDSVSEHTWAHILLYKIVHIFRRNSESDTKQAKTHYLAVLKQGADAWNQWREEKDNRDVQPDLSLLTRDDLRGIDFSGVDLSEGNLESLFLKWKSFKKANLSGANLRHAYLRLADLENANLSGADLKGATLLAANLQQADLSRAHLEGVDLRGANLKGANLSEVFFDGTTRLGVLEDIVDEGMEIDGIYLADGHWGDVNLAVVSWASLKTLGEELDAQRTGTGSAYEKAARVNQQLAVALRNQGLSEEAIRFAYQAHVLQRELLRQRISRWQRRPGAFRSLLRFLGVVGGVATLILFFLVFGIAGSIGYQQRQCQPDSFNISRQTICPSLLTQLGHLSPALFIPTYIILGVLVLTFLPVLYLRQKVQQNLKQVLILLLVLISGLLLLVLPLLLSVSPVLEYLGSRLTHLDPQLMPQLQIFLFIWGGQYLLLCLPWSKIGNQVGIWGRGERWILILILEEVVCVLLSLLYFSSRAYYGLPSNQELSSLLPRPTYTNFFLFNFVYSPQFPFLWFTFLLLLLSVFLLPLSKMHWLRTSWGLLLVMVLGWFVILEDQLQGLAEYRKYYGLPDFEWTLLKLGPISPGILFLLFLFLIPILQRVPKIWQLRKWMFNQPKTSLKEVLTGYGQYTLSLFLEAIAGYGYKPGRTLGWYVSVILIFAVVYSLVGTASGDTLSLNEALVFSVTSFHGRGFFPGFPQDIHLLRNPLVVLAAFEAVIGLVIEISFITTFTQRFFGK